MKKLYLLALVTIMSGCTSISKGVTEAMLAEKAEIDTRQCEIKGRSFSGVRQSLEKQSTRSGTTKMLMVHGISKHIPGYSTRFREKLATNLGLDLVSENYKEIIIQSPDYKTEQGLPENLGILRVTRHTNLEQTHEFLFYELTWSQISDAARDELAFDNSGEYSFKRARVNEEIKKFVNSTVPDILLYRGASQKKINYAVGQAVCWGFSSDWDDLDKHVSGVCHTDDKTFTRNIDEDDYFYVTHSLGSRITLDTIANATTAKQDKLASSTVIDALKDKELQIYMLSNQLPLLQLGRERPEVTEQSDDYCRSDAIQYKDRVFKGLNLIAFSDPNDILSYPISPDYANKNIDSRLCSNIVNVNLNVTPVKNVLGFEFANPAAAHSGYYEDDRVISLISDGLTRERTSELVSERCRWIETIN